MKKLLILLIVLTAALTTFAQTGKNTSSKEKTITAPKTMYTCPMHPEVTSDNPGKCPKCGMTLVKKASPAKKSTTQGMKMDNSMKAMNMDSTKH